MNDRHTRESDDRLPPELRKLHEELSSIHIEERASFGPELRAELERVWEEEPEPSSRRSYRTPALLAAALGGLIVVTMAAPQARAGIADLFRTVQAEVQALLETPEDLGAPEVVMDRPDGEAEAPSRATPSRRALPTTGAAARSTPGSGLEANAFPDIVDRRQAETVIEVFYPDALQSRGIGGTVGLTLRVTEDGSVDGVRLLESSGVPALDEAALDAAPLLDFRPAVRDGEPTTAWVRFGVEFRPPPIEPVRDGETPPRP